MKKTAIALAMMATATLVQAQSKEFEGFSAGLGLAAVGANTKITGDTGNYIDMGKTSTVPRVDLSYAYAVDNKWLLGVGVTYDLAKTKSGSAQLGVENNGVDYTETLKFETKNHYSVYLQPTYALNNTTAVFAKLGYHSMKGSQTFTTTDPSDQNDSSSSRFKGIGYGVGVKTFLDKNLFLQAEAQIIDFKSKTFTDSVGSVDYKVKSTAGIVTIGYKF